MAQSSLFPDVLFRLPLGFGGCHHSLLSLQVFLCCINSNGPGIDFNMQFLNGFLLDPWQDTQICKCIYSMQKLQPMMPF